MIKANIYDKKLVVENFAVSDSVMFDTVKFTFPDNWNGYAKTAVFKTEDGETFNVVLDRVNPLCINENECYIPYEVIKSPYFYLSVFGVLDDSIATTTSVKVKVLQSGYAEGAEPSEPTPTEYQQLINLTQETKEIAHSVRVDADNGVFNGEQGIQGEKGEKGDKGDTGEVALEYANNTFAPAIKNTVSGEVVKLSDVSPIEHNTEIKLSGKNLIPFIYESTDYMGITITVNDNGSFTLNGTNESDMAYTRWIFSTITLEPGTYTLSGWQSDLAGSLRTTYGIDTGAGTTFTLTKTSTIDIFIVTDAGDTFDNVTIYPQLELGTTATDYAPYISDFSSVTVGRYGKNLLSFSIIPSSYTGVEYENGVLQIPAVPGNAACCESEYIYLPTNVKLCYKHTAINGERVIIRCFDKDGNNISQTINIGWGTYLVTYSGFWGYANSGAVFTLPKEVSFIQLAFAGIKPADGAEYCSYSNFQIEVGSTPTEYEIYIEPQTATANSDGIVEGVTSISPNMTLLSDADGVVMDVEYIADTKKYIDNKFAELSTTILNN